MPIAIGLSIVALFLTIVGMVLSQGRAVRSDIRDLRGELIAQGKDIAAVKAVVGFARASEVA